MYSRNQNKGYSDEDYDDEEQNEEYELYAYNLPPNYDGSRFRRSRRKKSLPESLPSGYKEDSHVSVSHAEHQEKKIGYEWLIESLSKKIGYEELLIISLIMILAAEGDRSDTLLLLCVLLLVD